MMRSTYNVIFFAERFGLKTSATKTKLSLMGAKKHSKVAEPLEQSAAGVHEIQVKQRQPVSQAQ